MALGRMKNPRALQPWGSLNSGDRIRTCDLRVMSPTSYQTALPRNLLVRKYRWPAHSVKNSPAGHHQVAPESLEKPFPGNEDHLPPSSVSSFSSRSALDCSCISSSMSLALFSRCCWSII